MLCFSYSPNVLLASDLSAKICDVGMAKLASRTVAHPGDGNGSTYKWAAPEQIHNQFCNSRADIYAFGVVCICTIHFFISMTNA